MDEKVTEFLAFTGIDDAEVAKAYLESCNGDVTNAINSWFTSGGAAPPTPNPTASAPPEPRRPTNPRSGVASLSDLNDEKSEEGKEDNEYYAGGEKSGVAVRGGKKTDKVEELFESARQHGATQGTEEDLQRPSGFGHFTGQARTLAGDVTSHPPTNQPEQPIVVAFYTNGIFTIDDGEARYMDDPANAQFMESIREGTCPPELLRPGGRPVSVSLIRKGVDYKPPEKPKYKAFGGTGQKLSSGTSPSRQNTSNFTGGGEWEGADESKPATSIQIRLSDGARVVARFNYSHTIGDIRRFISAFRPDLEAGSPLMTSFPIKMLDDDTKTVEELKLVNTVIIQQ